MTKAIAAVLILIAIALAAVHAKNVAVERVTVAMHSVAQ